MPLLVTMEGEFLPGALAGRAGKGATAATPRRSAGIGWSSALFRLQHQDLHLLDGEIGQVATFDAGRLRGGAPGSASAMAPRRERRRPHRGTPARSLFPDIKALLSCTNCHYISNPAAEARGQRPRPAASALL